MCYRRFIKVPHCRVSCVIPNMLYPVKKLRYKLRVRPFVANTIGVYGSLSMCHRDYRNFSVVYQLASIHIVGRYPFINGWWQKHFANGWFLSGRTPNITPNHSIFSLYWTTLEVKANWITYQEQFIGLCETFTVHLLVYFNPDLW